MTKPIERVQRQDSKSSVRHFSQRMPPLKAILCGDAEAGKTSIVQRLSGSQEPTSPTTGAGFSVFHIDVGGSAVEIRVWDTAGQETYRSLIRAYFRGAQIVFLVFDITNPDSLTSLPPWLDFIHELCPEDCPVLVVGNKIDLEDRRAISTAEAVAWTDSQGLSLIEVSSKTGQNLDQLLPLGYRLCASRVQPPSASETANAFSADPGNGSEEGGLVFDEETVRQSNQITLGEQRNGVAVMAQGEDAGTGGWNCC